MKACKKCGRPLNENENDLCPACNSTESHKRKKVTGIMGTIVLFGGIAVNLLTGGKWGKKA